MEEQIKARIAELEKAVEMMVAQANLEIASRQGAIAELKRLLEPAQVSVPAD